MSSDDVVNKTEHSPPIQLNTSQTHANSEAIEDVEEPMATSSKSSISNDSNDDFSANDRAELMRLASEVRLYHSASSRPASIVKVDDEALERKDTLYGLEVTDDIFDPAKPNFDLKKWIRMFLKLMREEGLEQKNAGVAFKNVNISGTGPALNIQSTVSDFIAPVTRPGKLFNFRKTQPRQILRNFDGLLKAGELLIVLGRPGSGCSTLLKTLTGQLHGLDLDKSSTIHYNGIEQERMVKEFQGEIIYNQEVDQHFPHLTVGQTLEHAAALRMSQTRPMQVPRQEMVKHMTQVAMAVYGLSHTYNTKVGNDFVRGVSGGERKRVSIAEMALAGSLLCAWDNSTRGLDSATALTFVRSLHTTSRLIGSSHAVAIYQASQAIYDLFDKAVVLYEGREIYFGKADAAKEYFERQGWYCPPRQTTGDFLTSVTNPDERQAAAGYEDKVPRTPDEFESRWRNSSEYQDLQRQIQDYEKEYSNGDHGTELQALRQYKGQQQAHHVRPKSAYVVSIPMQIRLNMKRGWQRIWNDKAATVVPIATNIIISLIIGSAFFNSPAATVAFTARGAVLFFAIVINALAAITEINSLYDQRPIVEKHKSYAFYHPATEAIAGIVLDIPIKLCLATAFNVIIYFLSGLRREPSQFFIFFLINYMAIFVMAAVFRTMAAITKTIDQAMALSAVLVLAIVIYTGFVVPIRYMGAWFGWIRWINPIFYAFEILVANEFHGRNFTCSALVPAYPGNVANAIAGTAGESFICNTVGAVAGELTVNGDRYIAEAYGYHYSHVWRNLGILFAFLFGFLAIYFVSVELNSSTTSTAEVLVFRRGHVPAYIQVAAKSKTKDEEETNTSDKIVEMDSEDDKDRAVNVIPPQTDVFTWRNVSYDIDVKDGSRRLLDNVSGFVKPGTLTALMGTSGAGKTTLLDVLAQRTTMGVITGDLFVNGGSLDSSFQRKTGYVQQQDLHLAMATVRESLQFSAVLRQPKSVSKSEKLSYVEDVIKMLKMEDFAEAVVGVPGQGLNVEQRKLLTIGVELAAKPKLLLFLDEPTSGLDSQSSWAICAFLRRLADSGQAVLCTVHQPSAILFQQFDRLLFLRKGGQTVYFGELGEQSRTLLNYFESNGARECGDAENPAEYMLEIVGGEDLDWVQTWNQSKEAQDVQREIDDIHVSKGSTTTDQDNDASAHSEFAMPLGAQILQVTRRVFQQYWRMPSYIAAKMLLSGASGLFIGFSFYNADSTLQGMQNVLYSLFMLTTIFSTLVQQIMPLFVTQRALYEVRERPSKAYSWKAFLIANIVVEIPWQIIAGLVVYATFYYPVVGIQSSERQGLVLLYCVQFFIYASTFAHMCIAAVPDAQSAGAIETLFFLMSLIFNGVMQSPTALPGFWIFMYRLSPMTYWVAGMATSMLHGRQVVCSNTELSIVNPPSGQTCGAYFEPYLQQAPGYLLNPDATEQCGYCAISSADTFLASAEIYWSDRWRNFGIIWAYIVFDIAAAVLLYYFLRVKVWGKKGGKQTPKESKPIEGQATDQEVEGIQRVNTLPFASAAVDALDRYQTANLQRAKSNPRNIHVV